MHRKERREIRDAVQRSGCNLWYGGEAGAQYTMGTPHAQANACMHALYCMALLGIAWHCTTLHRTALHCIALHCIASDCIALNGIALHCVALRCAALHCIVLHARMHVCMHACKHGRHWSANVNHRRQWSTMIDQWSTIGRPWPAMVPELPASP